MSSKYEIYNNNTKTQKCVKIEQTDFFNKNIFIKLEN